MATMRDFLLRVQREPEFADAALADPDSAMADYDLTVASAESVRRRDHTLRAQLRAYTPLEGVLAGELPAEYVPFEPFPNHPPETPWPNEISLENEILFNDRPITEERPGSEEGWTVRKDAILAAVSGPERQLKLIEMGFV